MVHHVSRKRLSYLHQDCSFSVVTQLARSVYNPSDWAAYLKLDKIKLHKFPNRFQTNAVKFSFFFFFLPYQAPFLLSYTAKSSKDEGTGVG